MADIKALLIAKHDADKAIVDELARRFPLDALVEVWLSCVQNVPSDAVVMGWGADGTVKVRLVYGKEIVRDVPYGAVRPSALSTPAPAPSAPAAREGTGYPPTLADARMHVERLTRSLSQPHSADERFFAINEARTWLAKTAATKADAATEDNESGVEGVCRACDPLVCEEQGRWQKRIEKVISEAGFEPCDASGNESGDPLDYSADQIESALTHALHLEEADAATEAVRLRAEDVEWVVNSIAELGVKIGDQFFFLYKGESLVYTEDEDDEPPLMWRHVGKREFGECCHPINDADPTKYGTVDVNDGRKWRPLLSAPAPTPAPSAKEGR